MLSERSYLILILLVYLINCKWSIHSLKQAAKDDFRSSSTIMRTQQLERQYQQFRNNLRERNISMVSHIQNNKFGYTKRPHKRIFYLFNLTMGQDTVQTYIQSNEPNYKWASIKVTQRQSILGLNPQKPFLLLTINDFPYDLETGVEHWLIWSNREVELSVVDDFLTKLLDLENFQYFSYTNPINKKTIPQIYHAQVFFYPKIIETDL